MAPQKVKTLIIAEAVLSNGSLEDFFQVSIRGQDQQVPIGMMMILVKKQWRLHSQEPTVHSM